MLSKQYLYITIDFPSHNNHIFLYHLNSHTLDYGSQQQTQIKLNTQQGDFIIDTTQVKSHDLQDRYQATHPLSPGTNTGVYFLFSHSQKIKTK